jgi:hypothetical protein
MKREGINENIVTVFLISSDNVHVHMRSNRYLILQAKMVQKFLLYFI